jgi:nitroimidazol reductase NimA-like FMN-containing flavoprotein (pyridoxamine 5'-phosphate oxidase superfamily)
MLDADHTYRIGTAKGLAMTTVDLNAHARALIDANLYLTLGTVDADGRPWTTPVYFAPGEDREFYWLSATDSEHSLNLAERPQVSLVIFDSTVDPYHGNAVYAVGSARELSGDDVDRALELYPRPGGKGVRRFAREEVVAPAAYRLYRATASNLWVLCPGEPGQPCVLHDITKDHRVQVPTA